MLQHLNWLPKIELRGPGPPGRQYYNLVILHLCTLVHEDASKTEETIEFFVTFLSLVSFQLGGQAPLHPSWLRNSLIYVFAYCFRLF